MNKHEQFITREKIGATLLAAAVFSVLIWQRFWISPVCETKITRTHGSVAYSVGQMIPRGTILKTEQAAFVRLSVCDEMFIDLDEQTHLTVKSLRKEQPAFGFGHGRIVVSAPNASVRIDTPSTETTVAHARISFVGYDFKRLTSILPLSGSAELFFPLTQTRLTVNSPLTIHDQNPPTTEPTTFDETTGIYASFYTWSKE